MIFRLLPLLDRETSPTPNEVGADWTDHRAGPGTLAKYSTALVVPVADVPPERLKSVPSPWARVLLFEQALIATKHPAHRAVLEEWRGLLGCLALTNYLRLRLEATPVDLANVSRTIAALRQMVPTDDTALLWDRMALLRVDGVLVGGTSPRTLVFTSIRADTPASVPFQRGRRLTDPTAHYAEREDRESLALLDAWLRRVLVVLPEVRTAADQLLGRQPAPRDMQPVSRLTPLMELLGSWQKENADALDTLGGSPFPTDVEFADTRTLAAAFPDTHPAADVFARLQPALTPAGASTRSALRVRDGDRIIDPGSRGVILRDGHPFTGRVQLPAGRSADVKNGRFILDLGAAQLGDPAAADLGSFFEPRLIEIVGANLDYTTIFGAVDSQYLLPFRPTILEHVEPTLLRTHLTMSGDAAAGITIALEIPVQDGLSVRYEHHYDTRDITRNVYTPELAVWPDFHSREWDKYFYLVRHTAARNRLTLAPVNQATVQQAGSPDGRMKWGQTSAPVRAWQGLTEDGAAGLLLARMPDEVTPEGTTWDVAIDFGSTHTRVFRAMQGVAGGTLAAPVALTPRAIRLLNYSGDLLNHFFAAQGDDIGNAEEPRSLVRVPDAGLRDMPANQWLPSDGVIFWQALTSESAATTGLRANLKWHDPNSADLPAFHSYISQLYLSVAAEAAATGARVRSVVTAYPSVFPNHLRWSHEREWGLLSEFGVKVKPAQAESAALAAYLVERGANMATTLLAVDVGGSTSDLAVWSRNQRASGDSIRLAGDVLSRLVTTSKPTREAIQQAVIHRPISVGSLPWKDQGDSANALVFNELLRLVARKTGSTIMLARNLYQGPDSPGEWIIAHAAYLFATTSYLLGLMARRDAPGLDRYEIHFAGHGSEFLRWLDVLEPDAATRVPAIFFRAALRGSPEVEVDVRLPEAEAKQEVGRGLLAAPVVEQWPDRERTTFIGETGFSSEHGALAPDAPLTPDTLRAIVAPNSPVPLSELVELQHFLKTFSHDGVTNVIGRALGISPERMDQRLRDHIHNRLFGPQSAWQAHRAQGTNADHSLLEPFFVVEAKAVLEHVTDNIGLFSA